MKQVLVLVGALLLSSTMMNAQLHDGTWPCKLCKTAVNIPNDGVKSIINQLALAENQTVVVEAVTTPAGKNLGLATHETYRLTILENGKAIRSEEISIKIE